MILGIDASNICSGGGLTHLVELLRIAEPGKYGFEMVIIWAPLSTLSSIDDRPWLIKRSVSVLETNYVFRAVWQWRQLGELARKENCNLLFIPGGSFLTKFRPIVTMSQNLLPFVFTELRRYGLSLFTLKWLLLRISQSMSFKRSNGTIFLTKYARDIVLKVTGPLTGGEIIIPHGLGDRFFAPPRTQRSISSCDTEDPFKIIYVSNIEPYKHQLNVVVAVNRLHEKGVPIRLELYGSSNLVNQSNLNVILKIADSSNNSIKYHGDIDHKDIHKKYMEADIALFASSCETFGQILLEAMAAGLPIACSYMSAMPELLDDGGIYFDPLSPDSIAAALQRFIESPKLRQKKACKSYELAKQYSWSLCADETFNFLKLYLDREK